jgi:hypothetical protein
MNEMGSVSPLFEMVTTIGNGYERCATASLPERNILKDLRHILLAAHMHIPSRHVEISEKRYNTLCNQLGTITLLRMFYPMLAVLNVVDVLKGL